MKRIAMLLVAAVLFTSVGLYAQTDVLVVEGTKVGIAETPTPANVLKWTKEAWPKVQELSAKLKEMKLDDADNQRELVKKQQMIRNVQKRFEAINAKGTKLTAAEAKRHDTWLRSQLSKSIDECLATNPGSECCFGCQNGGGAGYGNFWCLVNCFVARFPGIN